jgi:phosphoribosylanthranilate isomerase
VVEVKFCGLTRVVDARFAAQVGATYAGVIFAGGPRERTAAQAAELWEAIPRTVRRVGVFGHDAVERIPRVQETVALDVVQLHGDPTSAELQAVRRVFTGEVWVVARTEGAALPEGIATFFAEADAVVLDAKVAGQLGGTGVAFDWQGVAEALEPARATARLVVAGGLRPHNVAEAVRILRPQVVDVSSGVESAPGIKDQSRMRAFFEAAQERAG